MPGGAPATGPADSRATREVCRPRLATTSATTSETPPSPSTHHHQQRDGRVSDQVSGASVGISVDVPHIRAFRLRAHKPSRQQAATITVAATAASAAALMMGSWEVSFGLVTLALHEGARLAWLLHQASESAIRRQFGQRARRHELVATPAGLELRIEGELRERWAWRDVRCENVDGALEVRSTDGVLVHLCDETDHIEPLLRACEEFTGQDAPWTTDWAATERRGHTRGPISREPNGRPACSTSTRC